MLIQDYEKNNTVEKCTFCDDVMPSAVWHGSNNIFCCKSCAIEKLPKLIADAIVGGTDKETLHDKKILPIDVFKEKEILNNFHTAFSGALIRKLRLDQN